MKGNTMAAMITLLFLILPLVAVPVVSAKPKTFSGSEIIYAGPPLGPDDHWKGPISGDITGTVEFWETDANFVVGQTEHFFETFLITTACGTISGTDDGIWNFPTFKFRAAGPVTAVTGTCSPRLVGYMFHETGFTSDPFATDLTYTVGVASWSMTP